MIPAVNESAKIKLALAVPTSAPITLHKYVIKTPRLGADKTIKDLSK